MGLRSVAYSLYERRLLAGLDTDRVPRHVGVILDGNRRWATLQGATPRPDTEWAVNASPSSCAGATTSTSKWSRCGSCPPII